MFDECQTILSNKCQLKRNSNKISLKSKSTWCSFLSDENIFRNSTDIFIGDFFHFSRWKREFLISLTRFYPIEMLFRSLNLVFLLVFSLWSYFRLDRLRTKHFSPLSSRSFKWQNQLDDSMHNDDDERVLFDLDH